MNSLIVFLFKTLKTFFVIPLLIINLIRKSFTQSVREFYYLSTEQISDTITPIIDWIYEKITNFMYSIKTTLRMVAKFTSILLVLSINTFLICILFNYFLILPAKIHHEVEFQFTDDNNSLTSEFLFDQTTHYCANCIDLGKYTYTLSVDFEFANKNYPDDTNNYELEMRLFSIKGDENVKKLFYFDKQDNIIELISKVATLPFRIIGYMNTKRVELILIEEYDNWNKPIDKIELFLKSKSINVKKCVFNFNPKIGIIKRYLAYLKYFALPVLYFILLFSQLIICFILTYIFRKPVIEESSINTNTNTNISRLEGMVG